MKNWKRWLCAFTFHTYRPAYVLGPNVVEQCTFCGGERVR